jgi:hypothetical protein
VAGAEIGAGMEGHVETVAIVCPYFVCPYCKRQSADFEAAKAHDGECGAHPMAAKIAELERRNAELAAALQWWSELTQESKGVAGWHLNGDIAPWSKFDLPGSDPADILAAHDAALVKPLVDAIHEALAPLGTGKCLANTCEGCLFETQEAIRILNAAIAPYQKTEVKP